jgi:hypothetical protein
MNGSSHPKHENLISFFIDFMSKPTPFLGSLGRLVLVLAGQIGLKRYTALEPPRGRPVGGGGSYHYRGMGVSTPITLSEECDFNKKPSFPFDSLPLIRYLESNPLFFRGFPMKIILFEKSRGPLFYHCDERRRPRRDAPAAVLMTNLLKQSCPVCQKEVMMLGISQ